MTHDPLKPIEDIHEILSPWHRGTLSSDAIKLYTAIWYRLRNKGLKSVWMDDDEASRRARILIKFIPAAQTELARSALLHMVPGERQTCYELIDTAESEQ